MKTMTKKVKLALAVMAGVLAFALSADAKPSAPRDEASPRLTRKGAAGHIDIRAGRKHFPKDAEVSIERARPDDVKRKIHEGWGRRHRKGASPRRTRLMAGSAPEASPKVLASYDIAIKSGGSKWQPDADDPVRVTVELDAPVTVGSTSTLGVVHLADDGTVEELESSRYGFVYDATHTLVTAFWFDASGFSVYAITETEAPKTDSTPARRLYDFYSLDFNRFLEDGVTSNTTYNTYVPRYFKTLEGNYTFRQIVTNNQYLVRPEALPSPLGRTFMGWYLYSTNNANSTVDGVTYDADGYATTPFDFNDPVAFNDGETGEHEYVLRSMFDRVGYVIFHEQPTQGTWPITAVRRGIMTEISPGVMQTSVEIGDLKVTYDDTEDENSSHENTTPRMIFRGWSTNQVMPGASMDVNGNKIKIEESPFTFTRTKDTEAVPRHLFPVFVNINWLTFKAAPTGEGATYIPPRFYYADEGTNSFPVPLRTGYTFNGWWTGPDTNTATRVSNNDGSLNTSANLSGWDGYIADGQLRLNANVTVYGAWTPAPTRYTVVIWQQSATDAANLDVANKTYDFVVSYTNTALSASTVPVAQAYKNFDYDNFHYARCDDAKVIDGNGSTVLNVYYDRNERTMTFRVQSGGYYSSYTTVETVTALAGSSVKDVFPIEGYTGKSWVGNTYYTERLVGFDIMPDTDITFTLSSATGNGGTIRYYLEVGSADEMGDGGVTEDGKYYKLYRTVIHDYNFLTKKEDFYDIELSQRSRVIQKL